MGILAKQVLNSINNANTYEEMSIYIQEAIEQNLFISIRKEIQKSIENKEFDETYFTLIDLLSRKVIYAEEGPSTINDEVMHMVKTIMQTCKNNPEFGYSLTGQRLFTFIAAGICGDYIDRVSDNILYEFSKLVWELVSDDQENCDVTECDYSIIREVIKCPRDEIAANRRGRIGVFANINAYDMTTVSDILILNTGDYYIEMLKGLDDINISNIIGNDIGTLLTKLPVYEEYEDVHMNILRGIYRYISHLRRYYANDIKSTEQIYITEGKMIFEACVMHSLLNVCITNKDYIKAVLNFCHDIVLQHFNTHKVLQQSICKIHNIVCEYETIDKIYNSHSEFKHSLSKMIFSDSIYTDDSEDTEQPIDIYISIKVANIVDIIMRSNDEIALEAEDGTDSKDDVEPLDDSDDDEDEDVPEIDATQSKKGYSKTSKKMQGGQKKIYNMYKKYKNSENKVDSQLTKITNSIKNLVRGDKTAEILGEKEFSAVRLLKKIMVTGAIFNYSKIAGILYLIVDGTMAKKSTEKQRKQLIRTFEAEIEIIDEKIEDARGDGNRDAKYALKRTRNELKEALETVKYGLTASEKAISTAKSVAKRVRKEV